MSYEEKSQLVIDQEGGLRRVGGDKELYDELIELFMDSSVDQIEQLREAVKNKETDTLRKVAHSIKGSAANLGIVQVQQTAYDIEKYGNEENIDEAAQSVEKLISEIERVKVYLQQ